MISYPFFADQPRLAEKCRSLGLAIPLTDAPRGRVTAHDALAAFAEIARSRDSLLARLDEAREWELEALANRDSVHRRIAGLVSRAARATA